MTTTDVEVILPWRPGCEHRELALAWVAPRYPWPVTVATAPPGEWCKAAAVAPAAEASTADVLVIADADVWCDGTADAVEAVIDGHPWAMPHTLVHRLTPGATAVMLAGREPDPAYRVEERPYRGVMGGGIVVLPRETYLHCPLDPRFTGWGQEDASWATALTTLAGDRWRGTSDLIHLWHPPQPRLTRKIGSADGETLHRRYELALNDPARMSLLVEEARQCQSPVS
jgi:hypothetical protein